MQSGILVVCLTEVINLQINQHVLLSGDCVVLGHFTIQNVGPQQDGDNSKVKVKVRVNVHGIFSIANASVIEKQNTDGDLNEVPMDTDLSCKNQSKDELVCIILLTLQI